MADATPTVRASLRQNVVGGLLGSILEWYDFVVYAYLAPIFAKHFFPSDDPFESLLASYGAFAVGFLARPVGAVVFGHLADTKSRRLVLLVSMTIMGLATLAIGLLPGAAELGVAAGILLVLLRLIQGFSLAGENCSGWAFIAEHAPDGRRGYLLSWWAGFACGGVLLGSLLVTAMTHVLGEAQMADWGWRVPFILGAVMSAVIYWIRRRTVEPEGMRRLTDREVLPINTVLRHHKRDLLRLCAINLAEGVVFYFVLVYALSYLTQQMHVSTARAMDINILSIVIIMVLPIPLGALSDRIGRKPILLIAVGGLALLSWPLFWLMHQPDIVAIVAAQIGFAILLSFYLASMVAMQAEIVPPGVRATLLALAVSLTNAVFGGTTPMIVTYLVHRTSDDFAAIYYVIGACLVTLAVVLRLPETKGVSVFPDRSP